MDYIKTALSIMICKDKHVNLFYYSFEKLIKPFYIIITQSIIINIIT